MLSIWLTIYVSVLVWRCICLRNWLVHPEATLQRTIKQWRMLHRVFFFVPFLVPYRYYERNPSYAIRAYITGEVVFIILLVIVGGLTIIAMVTAK